MATLSTERKRKIQENTPTGYMIHDVLAYVERGELHGDFLKAVVCSDLVHAFQYADSDNIRVMRGWAGLVYNCLPAECWGSVEKVTKWQERGGINGLDD